MTRDERLREYLWNRAAPADPEVEAIERQLVTLGFDPAARPFRVPDTRPARANRLVARHVVARLALAAALIVAAGSGYFAWRFSWPEGRAWSVASTRGSVGKELQVGQTLVVGESDQALVGIARIGTMRVDGGASIALRATSGLRHRLRMDRGTVHIRTWAPPTAVVLDTPSGLVIDVGCEFLLTVTEEETAVRVLSGWVELENSVGERLIPKGASSAMSPGVAPGVPVFDDAAPAFKAAVRALEAGGGEPAARDAARLARKRDVMTLLVLADSPLAGDEILLTRAADLSPPPGGITVDGILRGDRRGLWRWHQSLPLPPPKSWVRNWRDGLPEWMVRRHVR
jgi:ferric-dicitrate binding protein FerR (iron transport regulator)